MKVTDINPALLGCPVRVTWDVPSESGETVMWTRTAVGVLMGWASGTVLDAVDLHFAEWSATFAVPPDAEVEPVMPPRPASGLVAPPGPLLIGGQPR
jgi:hypothetical protein